MIWLGVIPYFVVPLLFWCPLPFVLLVFFKMTFICHFRCLLSIRLFSIPFTSPIAFPVRQRERESAGKV
jgi:hypothetical protein